MEIHYEREWPMVAYLIYCGHELQGDPVFEDGTWQFPFRASETLMKSRDEYWLSEYKAVQEIYRRLVSPKTKRK